MRMRDLVILLVHMITIILRLVRPDTVLHSFTGGADGANPAFGFLLLSKGSLYGTASAGGVHGAGVVFKIQLRDE